MAIAGNVMHFKSEFAFFQSVCEPAVSSQVLNSLERHSSPSRKRKRTVVSNLSNFTHMSIS